MLRLVPPLTLALLLGPLLLGLGWTLLPAFGWFPAIGGDSLSLDPFRALFAWPGFPAALRQTLMSGIGAALLSLALAVAFCAAAWERPWFLRAERWLAMLLAPPHAAVALGLAFLVAPSGLAARLAGLPAGWDRPPQDWPMEERGVAALILGLAAKEVPYLVLMLIGAAGQAGIRPALAAARALGHGPRLAFLKVALPRLYPQIRLPVYAVLAYSLSVVDVGLILGPGNPPTLAVLAQRWFADHELAMYFPAAAAAVLMGGLVLSAICCWRLGEMLAAAAGRRWLEGGGRRGEAAVAALGRLGAAVAAAGLVGLVLMALWSVAVHWRFPALLPAGPTAETWLRLAGPALLAPLGETLAIACTSTAVALVLAVLCLEAEQRCGLKPGAGALWLIYLPLLVPQIAFLFGIQLVLLRSGLDGTRLAVAWVHLVFVLPYVFLSLADPWRALDPRLVRVAAGLGRGPWTILARVKLPLLLPSLAIAAAVGVAVSAGQYLPTLFAGGGRIATLTTEAVTLAAGGDRRVIGVFAVLQAAVPLAGFALALGLPRMLRRH
ncbi:MAG: ABC transporter permease subunit [Thalassobaculales bacterium]